MKGAKKKKSSRTMADVSKGYEAFISTKEVRKDGGAVFKKTIKKATKQSGSK